MGIMAIDKSPYRIYDKSNIPATPLPYGMRNMAGLFLGLTHGRV